MSLYDFDCSVGFWVFFVVIVVCLGIIGKREVFRIIEGWLFWVDELFCYGLKCF